MWLGVGGGGGDGPLPRGSGWGAESLTQWEEEEGFSLGGREWLLSSPPSSSSKGARSAGSWYSYFKEVESWLGRVETAGRRSPALFYQQAPFVFHAAFQLVLALDAVLTLDPDLLVKKELERRVWSRGVQEVLKLLRGEEKRKWEEEEEYVIMFFRNRAYIWFLVKMVAAFEILAANVERRGGLQLGAQRELKEFVDPLWEEPEYAPFLDLAYRLRIYIADLYRYALPQRSQFPAALRNYEVARLLKPDNGRAYYQMGVVFAKSDDLLSAFFAFLRAHLLPLPVDRAREDVLEVHAQAFKKRLNKKSSYWYALSKQLEDVVKYKTSRAKWETWVLQRPFQGRPTPPTEEAPPPRKMDHVARENLPLSVLWGRFTVSYLDSLGKLFSRVGMDEFPETAEEALVYFEALLGRNEKVLDLDRMVYLVGSLVMVVDALVQVRKRNDVSRDQVKHDLKLGVLFLLELFSVLVERLDRLILLLDWDNPQLLPLTSAVLVLALYLQENPKVWARPHCRPVFAIRRIEGSRNLNKADPTDDVFTAVAELMNRIEVLLFREGRELVFPRIDCLDAERKGEKLTKKMGALREAFLLGQGQSHQGKGKGQGPFSAFGKWFGKRHWMERKGSEEKAGVLLRLWGIHQFGLFLTKDPLCYLSLTPGHGVKEGSRRFACNTKLLIPKDVKDAPGLCERNYWFWILSFRRRKQKEQEDANKGRRSLRAGDSNNAQILLKRPKGSRVTDLELPQTDNQQLWGILSDQGYRSDMIVYPKNVLLDTNCFIQKMWCVKKLLKIFPYPIVLPVAVILELKGLKKGGLKSQDREKYGSDPSTFSTKTLELSQKGHETAEFARDALAFIQDNRRYFRLCTSGGLLAPIPNRLQDKVTDSDFDPKERFDSRILRGAIALEMRRNEWGLRGKESPLRLYRRTVILTGDLGLRVKAISHEVPTRDIEAFTFWVQRYDNERKR